MSDFYGFFETIYGPAVLKFISSTPIYEQEGGVFDPMPTASFAVPFSTEISVLPAGYSVKALTMRTRAPTLIATTMVLYATTRPCLSPTTVALT